MAAPAAQPGWRAWAAPCPPGLAGAKGRKLDKQLLQPACRGWATQGKREGVRGWVHARRAVWQQGAPAGAHAGAPAHRPAAALSAASNGAGGRRLLSRSPSTSGPMSRRICRRALSCWPATTPAASWLAAAHSTRLAAAELSSEPAEGEARRRRSSTAAPPSAAQLASDAAVGVQLPQLSGSSRALPLEEAWRPGGSGVEGRSAEPAEPYGEPGAGRPAAAAPGHSASSPPSPPAGQSRRPSTEAALCEGAASSAAARAAAAASAAAAAAAASAACCAAATAAACSAALAAVASSTALAALAAAASCAALMAAASK